MCLRITPHKSVIAKGNTIMTLQVISRSHHDQFNEQVNGPFLSVDALLTCVLSMVVEVWVLINIELLPKIRRKLEKFGDFPSPYELDIFSCILGSSIQELPVSSPAFGNFRRSSSSMAFNLLAYMLTFCPYRYRK